MTKSSRGRIYVINLFVKFRVIRLKTFQVRKSSRLQYSLVGVAVVILTNFDYKAYTQSFNNRKHICQKRWSQGKTIMNTGPVKVIRISETNYLPNHFTSFYFFYIFNYKSNLLNSDLGKFV